MKKSLFYLAATLLIATTSCSEDNNDDDPKGQESNITLYAPDDLEEFDLLYENPTRKLKFEWEGHYGRALVFPTCVFFERCICKRAFTVPILDISGSIKSGRIFKYDLLPFFCGNLIERPNPAPVHVNGSAV